MPATMLVGAAVVLLLSLAPACVFAADGVAADLAGHSTGQQTQALQARDAETTENKMAGPAAFGVDNVRFFAALLNFKLATGSWDCGEMLSLYVVPSIPSLASAPPTKSASTQQSHSYALLENLNR